MQISEHERRWLTEDGAKMVTTLGVKNGSSVIDFGCGKGRYTIPLSQAVGKAGNVLAVERNPDETALLDKRIATFGKHGTIEILQSETIRLSSVTDGTIDSVFAFDVLQYIDDWGTFFTSVHRVLKSTGCIHVYPAAVPHPEAVNVSLLAAKLNNAGLQPDATRQFTMMHNKDMVTDTVYTFRPSSHPRLPHAAAVR